MTEREVSRNAARRLSIIRHAEEVTGNVSLRPVGISGSPAKLSTSG
jgi:hypothetical protein